MIGRLVRLCRKSRKCMLLREGDRAGRLYRSSKRSSVGRVSRKVRTPKGSPLRRVLGTKAVDSRRAAGRQKVVGSKASGVRTTGAKAAAKAARAACIA